MIRKTTCWALLATMVLVSIQSAYAYNMYTNEHIDLVYKHLDMINDFRESYGREPVKLGNNNAAQNHAEIMLSNCFLSHWDLSGYKPYMRYWEQGGRQKDSENVAGYTTCVKYNKIEPVKELYTLMELFIESEGHKRTMLGKDYKYVNIGIAFNNKQMYLVQQFETDFIEYTNVKMNKIKMLFLEGEVKNANLGKLLYIVVSYDPLPWVSEQKYMKESPPYYCGGLPLQVILPPIRGLPFNLKGSMDTTEKVCGSPPYFINDMIKFTLPFTTASKMTYSTNDFSIRLELKDIVDKYGYGVYTFDIYTTQPNSQDSLHIGRHIIFNK